MAYSIKKTITEKSAVGEVDFDNLSMGKRYTDHMFIADYENGEWHNPRIEPLAPIATHPATMALHYGQAIFEGMKATIGKDGKAVIFRPEQNAKRFNLSAQRIGMPTVPEDLFVQALKEFVAIENEWVPKAEGSALYLRPFMYADEHFIGMRAATSYKFIIIASPAGKYFSKPIKLYAETKYVRAVNGGTGEAKVAGNYAAAILPTELAKQKGYDQVLWLDPYNFEYVQEAGTMNIFFKIGGKFITPDLNGSILAGITRLSCIELLRDKGYEVEERPITIAEIMEASENGTLEEAFGAGTAVGIALVAEIGYKDKTIKFPAENPVATEVNNQMNAIKMGTAEDKFGWMVAAE